ncbi:hypothetical protein Tco_0115621 [Tanacetum coccineum]
MPHDLPLLGGSTPGSVEGSMQLKELMNLCTKLLARVTSLETELKKTKEVHGKALTKLVKKGRDGRDKYVDVEEKCWSGIRIDLMTQQVTHLKNSTGTEEPKELSEEDLKKMLEIVPVEEFMVEALQTKYPIIDWETHTEGSKKYWKIIRVGNITEAYQGFEDMLKAFNREDLDTLWSLVK